MRAVAMAALALAVFAGAVQAQTGGRGPTGQLVYPAKGQDPTQADRDRFECHAWSRQQSGFDPTAMATAAAAAPPSARPGTSAGGMAAGAAGGAAIAELADKDAGKGAAVGLLGAGLRQQMQHSRQLGLQQEQALQQQAALAQKRASYDRGFAACMEARGYVVR